MPPVLPPLDSYHAVMAYCRQWYPCRVENGQEVCVTHAEQTTVAAIQPEISVGGGGVGMPLIGAAGGFDSWWCVD